MNEASRFDAETERLRLKILYDMAHGRPIRFHEMQERNAFQLGIGKGYERGKGNFVDVRVGIPAEGKDYIISFCVEPVHYRRSPAGVDVPGDDRELSDIDHVLQCEAMFVGARDTAQKAQEIVAACPLLPARIRFVSFEYRIEGSRNVLALVPCDGLIEIVRRLPERKVGVPPGPAGNQVAGGAGGLIQRIPHVLNDIVGQPANLMWDWLEAYFQFVPSVVVITLFDHSCRGRIAEGFQERFQLLDLAIRPPG